MTRIAHLSDPHFGTEQPGLPESLARHLATLAPDLILLSGDLTQRAEANGRDELSELMRTLGEMQGSLSRIVGEVRPAQQLEKRPAQDEREVRRSPGLASTVAGVKRERIHWRSMPPAANQLPTPGALFRRPASRLSAIANRDLASSQGR